MEENEDRKSVKITESTLFPLSILFVIMGGMFWITMMYAQVMENTKQIAELKIKQDQYNFDIKKITTDLAEIKGALGMKKRGNGE